MPFRELAVRLAVIAGTVGLLWLLCIERRKAPQYKYDYWFHYWLFTTPAGFGCGAVALAAFALAQVAWLLVALANPPH